MRLDETMKTKTNTMNSTHTPGPWTVYRPATADTCYEGGDAPATIRAACGIHVATMPGDRESWDVDWSSIKAANARLISCAPEMLEALARLLNEVESICAHGAGETRDELLERLHRDWDGKLRAARMVITKAKGIEP